ncbi:hypothetical protein HN935_03000 [archaeon]|nr:hypothetical protein [archaeon]
MDNWKEFELGEIIEFIRNGANMKQSKEGKFPITRIETIWNAKIDEKRVKFCDPSNEAIKKYSLIYGDILFSHINSPSHIGKTAIYLGSPEVLIHGINLLLIRPNKEFVDPKYLERFLKTRDVRRFFELRCKKAVNQASLNQGAILPTKVPIPLLKDGTPDLEKQKQIVAILEKAEGLKDKRKGLDELFDEYSKSIFYEMFLKEKGKFEEVFGKDLFDLAYGKGLSGKDRSGLGFAVYGSNGVVGYHEKALVNGPGIIVGRKGSIGEINFSKEDFWPIDTTYYLIPKKDLDWTFLFYLLMFTRLKHLNKSAAVPGLNRNDVYTIKFSYPPMELQGKFASIVEQAEKIKDKLKDEKKDSDELFNALMQKAFSGELI